LIQMFRENYHLVLLTCQPFLELIPKERHRQRLWSTIWVKLPNAFPDAAASCIPAVARRDFEAKNVETDSSRAKDQALKLRNSWEAPQEIN
jgi:hypothetical protein